MALVKSSYDSALYNVNLGWWFNHAWVGHMVWRTSPLPWAMASGRNSRSHEYLCWNLTNELRATPEPFRGMDTVLQVYHRHSCISCFWCLSLIQHYDNTEAVVALCRWEAIWTRYFFTTGTPHGGPMVDYCGGFPLSCYTSTKICKTKPRIQLRWVQADPSNVSALIFACEVIGGFGYGVTYGRTVLYHRLHVPVLGSFRVADIQVQSRLNSKSLATCSCRGATRQN